MECFCVVLTVLWPVIQYMKVDAARLSRASMFVFLPESFSCNFFLFLLHGFTRISYVFYSFLCFIILFSAFMMIRECFMNLVEWINFAFDQNM